MRAFSSQAYRNAQSTLEYAFLIAIVVGTVLGIQAYLKRSLQGQLQMTSDQVADQYAYGLTQGQEHFESQTRFFELNAPGWSHPTTIMTNRGSYDAESEKGLRPLEDVWPID